MGGQINDEIVELTEQGNRLATQIANLNEEIARIEAGGGGQANALRDRRDALLRDLAELFDVAVREQPDGSVNVYVGNEPLIQRGSSRGLAVEDSADGQFVRSSVRFADTNSQVNVSGGRIEGLIAARDQQMLGRVATVDRLAAAIISEVNAIHADGQGLRPFTSVTSVNAVDDPSAPLDSFEAGLAIAPVDGSFFITVTDEGSGTPVAHRIDLNLDGTDAGTSLDDLVAAINAEVDGITASITVDNRLSLTASAGLSFTFGHDGGQLRSDSSKALTALGINTFFDGSSAADIAVQEHLVADPGGLAAATVNRVGDGTNAGRIAGLLNTGSAYLNDTSILDSYNAIANSVAADGAIAKDATEAAEAVAQALQVQRESVSGVSLDEEAIDMLKFERAFQGAARFVSTVDRLMQEMLALVR
jgi:flagellar hook-associated protein 1 FlgK